MLEQSAPELTLQKQQLLLAYHKTCWEEMTWRRNAGYRTVILGFGYFAMLIAVVTFNHQIAQSIRICLAIVIALGTLFGAGYLTSNYSKYMAAAAQMVKIEEYTGAYGDSFLGSQGALMPPERRDRPKIPLSKDIVCLWSILAFLAGGLVTAGAILIM